MTRLLLVRHGRSEWTAAGRIQGQIEIQLDEIGLQQAQRIADRLAAEPVAAIYSSPLLRAKVTADAIAARFNLPVKLDPRLMEYDFGVLAALLGDVVGTLRFASRWLKTVGGSRSEGRVNFAARVMSAVQDITARHPAEQVVVVAHGGTFGVYLTAMLGLDLNRRHPFHFGNTSLSLVEVREGAFHIHYLNNTCHMLNGQAR
jgi:broad specificity phosphatase PhoE